MQNTMRSLFSQLGFEFDKMQFNQPIDVRHLGYEVKTLNAKTGKEEWNLVLNIVRKQQAEHMIVSSNGRSLSCSPDHKIFVKSKESDTAKYKEVGLLKNTFTSHVVLTDSGWREFVIESKDELTEIADIEVEGEHSYLSNGILSHNTLYGDPSTTPGGMAIPYHASTRIKLTGGQQIKQTINGKDAVVGINVTCKTIKNKVARPWREVSFEIHFGKGIRENEQLFDELREYCEKCKEPVIVDGMKVKVDGAGAWKYFTVSDNKTGEVVHDLKFYKSEFGEKVINNPEVQLYLTGLMDATFIMGNGDDNHKTLASIDLGSATEVEAVKAERASKSGKSLLSD